MKPLVSAYSAARVLERDRQTIERAVRGLVPDAYEGGQPRWRLTRIIEALAPGRADHAVNGRLEALFGQLDHADAEMRGLATLAGRRRLARERLLPLLRKVDAAMRADGKARGEPAVDLRIDRHTQFVLAGLSKAAERGCDWTLEQAYGELNEVTEGVR
jgi:hypothetical protein